MEAQQQQQQQDSPSGRRLLVRQSGASLIRDEFDSLRAKFDAEMRLMEQDMARFRSQMQSSFSGASKRSNSSTVSSAKKTTTIGCNVGRSPVRADQTTTKSGQQQLADGDRMESGPPDGRARPEVDWLEGFANSPMVVDSADGHARLLKLRFDVSAYEPGQIVVMTFDDRLQVCARSESSSEHARVSSEYNREFLLPANVDHELIKSTLSSDRILTVEVPLIAAGGGERD